MGIDKLRLISMQSPCNKFFEWVNSDLQVPSAHREKKILSVAFRHPLEEQVTDTTQCRIVSRPHCEPQFFLQLNFKAFHGHGCRQILEMNPNTFPEGLADLRRLITTIFGPDTADLKVSRIDLNAEAEVPVDYFHRSLRVPYKRKNSRFSTAEGAGLKTHLHRGTTGFQIGASPSLLRVYDKREDFKRQKKNLDGLPAVLTRLEWELRHRKSPIQYLSELPELLEIRPFDTLEFYETPHCYDFRHDPTDTLKRYQFNHLADDYGAHEAARIFNAQRHFKRDFRQLEVEAGALKEQLQDSYLSGVDRFFNNQCADPRFKR